MNKISKKPKRSEFDFFILRPSGNDTALVAGVVRNSMQRKIIADAIQAKFPNVEQVGFVNFDINKAELMMTGGEFCGNATSSASHKILAGQPGEIKIKVSGVKNKLRAGVTKDGEGFSHMPVYSDPSYVKSDPKNPLNFCVTLEGIVHYIDFDISQLKGLTIDQIKQKARNQMSELGIDQNAACGIIYSERFGDIWRIYPVVYVRDADTLYYETACGSGTTALGLVLAFQNSQSIIEVPITQPSGLNIKVSVEFDGNRYGHVRIQSRIQKLDDGVLKIAGNKITFSQLPKLPGYKRQMQKLEFNGSDFSNH